MRETTREKKQKLLPATAIRKELAVLGLFMASRGPLPHLMAQKETLLSQLEKLEGARKRSSQVGMVYQYC
jgi:hypothetical protein